MFFKGAITPSFQATCAFVRLTLAPRIPHTFMQLLSLPAERHTEVYFAANPKLSYPQMNPTSLQEVFSAGAKGLIG
jgi:hypothetical protein